MRIIGKSYYGVRHGLETFSQMIWWDEACGKQGCLRVLSQASVEDKPAFAYRGLLVDTGRQFFSLEQLKRVIDGTLRLFAHLFVALPRSEEEYTYMIFCRLLYNVLIILLSFRVGVFFFFAAMKINIYDAEGVGFVFLFFHETSCPG